MRTVTRGTAHARVLMGLLFGLALGIALIGCGAGTGSDGSASSNEGSVPTSSATATASPRASAEPSDEAATPPSEAPDLELAVGTIGEVIVTDLVVRSAPGVGDDSEILDQRLTEEETVYVVDGPVPADGYDWLLVAELHPFERQLVFGWIAPASREGEPWVVRAEPDCPSEVSVESFADASAALRLYCFGSQKLELTGALGFCGHGDPVVQEPPWLGNYACAFEAPGRPAGVSDWPTIGVHIRPGADVPSFTGEAAPVRVMGGFDVPEAQTCRYSEGAEDSFPDLDELDDLQLRFGCRMAFVVESALLIGP